MIPSPNFPGCIFPPPHLYHGLTSSWPGCQPATCRVPSTIHLPPPADSILLGGESLWWLCQGTWGEQTEIAGQAQETARTLEEEGRMVLGKRGDPGHVAGVWGPATGQTRHWRSRKGQMRRALPSIHQC